MAILPGGLGNISNVPVNCKVIKSFDTTCCHSGKATHPVVLMRPYDSHKGAKLMIKGSNSSSTSVKLRDTLLSRIALLNMSMIVD